LQPPAVDVNDQTVYIARGNTLTALNLRDGKVLFEGKLPDNMTRNVPLLPRQQNGQAARQQPGIANQQPETTTVVGTMRHVELEGGFWTIETRNGKKLVLGGDKLKELIATPNIDGAAVRLKGSVRTQAGIPQYGDGYFEVTAFEVLPAGKL
jgi:hypothetical protein